MSTNRINNFSTLTHQGLQVAKKCNEFFNSKKNIQVQFEFIKGNFEIVQWLLMPKSN